MRSESPKWSTGRTRDSEFEFRLDEMRPMITICDPVSVSDAPQCVRVVTFRYPYPVSCIHCSTSDFPKCVTVVTFQCEDTAEDTAEGFKVCNCRHFLMEPSATQSNGVDFGDPKAQSGPQVALVILNLNFAETK